MNVLGIEAPRLLEDQSGLVVLLSLPMRGPKPKQEPRWGRLIGQVTNPLPQACRERPVAGILRTLSLEGQQTTP